ncbi:SDR family oxidoreductase [Alkalihalobacterium alkalinitrilicum]|uniref:SDR family oxidoreductase n=1 Tax=Alkalihalobacterium alkalinitrilicum TaxID=427920 RepID=UPI00099538BB|nr:SDR family oxidoreductase [Alkalihalobacterium alkalinitrilicum]
MEVFSKSLLSEKVAIVTGGGTGIGKEIAKHLGTTGAKVVITGRREHVLQETAEEFRHLGIEVSTISTDIRDPEQVKNLVEHTVECFGRVDILINNAGGQFPKKAEELSPNGWNAVINNNLNGTFYVTQEVSKQFMKQGTGGSITNILVNFLHRGAPGIAHSVAARSGIYGMMKTLALEWAKHNIRINSIGPGLFVTEGMSEEMASFAGSDFISNVTEDVPLKRTGKLEELGWLVTYISSPAAEYITGEYIIIDGGNSLGRGITFLPY